jgi:hypothetical protein
MIDNSQIFELLKSHFPEEFEAVGPTNLGDIIAADISFVPSEHGSNMDLGGAIQILIVATSFIKTVIDIYTGLKKELGRDPDEADISIKIKLKKDLFLQLDPIVQRHLIESAIRGLRDDR